MTYSDELNKALDEVHRINKSQQNFVNGDGKDNQDTIHSNPLNNENGSISHSQGAAGDGNDPVNSSNLNHKNPVGQSANGVHAEGTKYTKTGNATSDHDPVSTSTDDLNQYSKESKSQVHHDHDRNAKDKNGVREVHTPVKNGTRNLGDKPNANAQAENNMTNTASGTKHNDADLGKNMGTLINLVKGLVGAVKVTSGNLNALKSSYINDIKSLNSRINKTAKAINAPKTVNNTQDKSDEAKNIIKNDADLDKAAADKEAQDNEDKHMPKANVRGMFYQAEHSKGKKHTKEMADAENAVTRCHNSHKSLTDDQWGDIEAKALVNAAKSILTQVEGDDAAKSLDSKLVADAKSGNKQALGHDNYEYDQSEKAKKAHKSVQTASTAAKAVDKGGSTSLADCMSMMASMKRAGNDSGVAHCASMCRAMKSGKAAKSEMADLNKNINSVDHDSKANTGNIRANSKQKPNSKSDDIDNSTKSESANTTKSESASTQKSMPHGRAINADTDKGTKKTIDKSMNNSNNHSAKKSIHFLTPKQARKQGALMAEYYKKHTTFTNKSMAHKAINIAKNADTSEKLQKSLTVFQGK